MKEIKVKLTVDSSGAEKSIDNVTDSTKKLDKANSNASKSNNSLSASTAKTGVAMGGVATASTSAATSLTALGGTVGAAAGGMSALKTKLQAVIVSLKSVKVAMMATGIGLVIVILASLRAAFTRSEEGQNKFAKAMAAIGAVTGVLMDGLAALGGLIIDVFTKPKEVFKDFSKSIKEFVTDKITKVTEGLGLLGSAIKKAFSGDFKGAFKDAKDGVVQLNRGLNPLVITAEAVAKGVKSIVTEMKEEAKIAGQIADIRAKADKVDRALIIDRAEANRKRAELLDKAANKEKFTAKERIEFLTEAGKIEDAITEKEISAAQLRLKAKKAENALGLSTKDDLDEEARLTAKLIDLQGAKLTKQKLVTSQISAANKEAAADQKALEAKAAADAKKIEAFTANTKEEKRKLEREKLKEQLAELLKLAGDDNEAKIELQKSFDERLLELKTKNAEKDAAEQKKIDDKVIADAKIISDKKIAEEKKVAAAKVAIQEQGLKVAGQAFSLLGQLGEDNKALQATALIGESGIGIAKMIIANNTANIAALATPQAVASSGASAAPVIAFNNISTALGVAATVAATAKGLAALGEGGAPAGGDAGAGGGATAPAFNLVEGTESNAIQDSITNQDTAIKAIVISGDVTTAQSADRNAVDSSGF